MKKIIGIDLGSSNSCVSIIEGKDTIIIPNEEGKRTTPSIVSIIDGDIRVGDGAKRQAITSPEKTIYTIKRLMGKTFNEVKDMELPYKVVDNKGSAAVEIDGKVYTPEEISAMILQKMKKTAEDYIGEEAESAIITVPAFFSDSERNSTKIAGEIAGLKVERIINEPTAASLSYGLNKKEDMKIAVFDFGGSTFDVSVLDMGDGVFEVSSTEGDVYLGGDECDSVIIKWLVEKFKEEHNVDLTKDPIVLQRLKDASEKAKIELSTAKTTEINLPYIMPIDGVPKHLVVNLTRAKFEHLIEDIIKKTMKPTKSALRKAGLKVADIDEVILVGGSTRIPAVQEAVEKFFKKKVNKSVNPDEVVSLGAAIQGGVLSGDVNDVLLLDVTPLSMGIETSGGVFTKLIEANTTIPTSKSETFTTAQDNQPSVDIHVLQGERPMSTDNKSLGKFKLDDIPPAPRGIPKIEVTFDIDANGILSVSAKDEVSGKENSITIEGGGQLSEEEIEKMKNEAEANADSDTKKKEEVDTLNQADGLIFQTNKQLGELDDKISEEDRTEIEASLNKLVESHGKGEIPETKENIKELNDTWSKITTKLYEQSGDSNDENTQPSDGNDDVTDVDFEEVDED